MILIELQSKITKKVGLQSANHGQLQVPWIKMATTKAVLLNTPVLKLETLFQFQTLINAAHAVETFLLLVLLAHRAFLTLSQLTCYIYYLITYLLRC